MKRPIKIPFMARQASRKRLLAAACLGIVLMAGWSVFGTRIIAAVNPALRHELSVAMHPALSVWIMPPDYARAAPIIISTPASILFEKDTITVPVGSVVSAHLAERAGNRAARRRIRRNVHAAPRTLSCAKVGVLGKEEAAALLSRRHRPGWFGRREPDSGAAV